MRHFNGRLTRKTLAYSKSVCNYRAAAAWEDAYYNLVRTHKSLRRQVTDDPIRRWKPRTPATLLGAQHVVVAGLTDHIWTVKELLTTLPVPTTTNT